MSVIFIVWNSSFEISILIIPDIHHNVGLASLGIPSISKCTSRVMWGSKLDLSWFSPQRGSCILGDRNLSCASQELLLRHKKFVVGWMLLQWRNHHKSWRQDFRNNHVEACPTENVYAVLLLWGPFLPCSLLLGCNMATFEWEDVVIPDTVTEEQKPWFVSFVKWCKTNYGTKLDPKLLANICTWESVVMSYIIFLWCSSDGRFRCPCISRILSTKIK